MVRRVAIGLDYLRKQVVFVGGAVVNLLITDPASPPARVSMDVDVIIEIASQIEYHKLRGPLTSLGFKEDSTGEPPLICRWNIDGIKVDIMPTDENILGFSNEWYVDAIETADWVNITEELSIRRISGPSFLMTKFAAFNDRGGGDYVGSPDIEDVIAVLDGRTEIIDEIINSHLKLKTSLIKTFKDLLQEEEFADSVLGHLPDRERYPTIIKRIQTIALMS
jgi:predicted nucleotidyltransferase